MVDQRRVQGSRGAVLAQASPVLDPGDRRHDLIGLINVVLGLASYHSPENPKRIDLGVGITDPNLIPSSQLPTAVVRGFVARYPHTIARGASKNGDNFVIEFPPGSPHHHATFTEAGAFVSED